MIYLIYIINIVCIRENINKNYYTTGEVADLFQISTKTIQKGDNKGILNF